MHHLAFGGVGLQIEYIALWLLRSQLHVGLSLFLRGTSDFEFPFDEPVLVLPPGYLVPFHQFAVDGISQKCGMGGYTFSGSRTCQETHIEMG